MTNRRNFIKSSMVGASALAMAPGLSNLFAQSKTAAIPKRFIFIRKSSGLRPAEFALPTFSNKDKELDKKKQALEVDLDKHELPEWMRVLDKHKKHMTILQGISCKMIENGHYSYSSTMGAFNSSKSTVGALKRATVDYELGHLFPAPFTHVELSFAGENTRGIVPGFSVPAPFQRNYCYADAQTAYDQLFKCVVNPKAVLSDITMIEYHRTRAEQVVKGLKGIEKRNLTNRINVFNSTIERNKKLLAKANDIVKYMPTLDKVHLNGGEDATTPQRQGAMTDVLVAAMTGGLTNVVTYVMDTLKTQIIGMPGNEAANIRIHGLGHGGVAGGMSNEECRALLRIEHLKQINTIIERFKKIPEGDGNMFDNTMICYFPSGGETHHSKGTEKPYIIMSGKNCQLDIAGRYIRLPYLGTEGHKTLGNLYTTLLNAHGNPIEHYGDLDSIMLDKKLSQTGAIKQLLA
jgi:hypothetical protein